MRRRFGLLAVLFFLLCSCGKDKKPVRVDTDTFFSVLDEMDGVRLDRELESTVYARKGLFWVTQALDAEHPEAGSFEQRLMVAHRGFDRPTLFLTEGYEMRDSYFEPSSVMHEIAEILDLNVVYVEHRYYGESLCREDSGYEYLRVRNSADDLHRVFELLSPYYTHKWASTGSSKNGMTAMYYQLHYPDDMAVAVPFAAPVIHGLADTRVFSYIRTQIRTEALHNAMDDYIVDMLVRRAEMMPFLREEVENNPELKFRLSMDEVYDLMLMDYKMGKFLYADDYGLNVPGPGDPAADMMRELLSVSSSSMFSFCSGDSYLQPYYVQCAGELGSYLMDWDPEFKERVKGLTVYIPQEDCIARYLLPEGALVSFDGGEMTRKLEDFYRNNDPSVLFIYGQQDPWTSMGLTDESYFKDKKNMHLFIHPERDHGVKISHFARSGTLIRIIENALGL